MLSSSGQPYCACRDVSKCPREYKRYCDQEKKVYKIYVYSKLKHVRPIKLSRFLMQLIVVCMLLIAYLQLADLTVSKRPGTSNRIEIHFAVFNHLYLCFSFMKLAETL